MNYLIRILIPVLLAVPGGFNTATAQTAGDEEAIRFVINEYIVGWREGDAERLSSIMELDHGHIIYRNGLEDDDPILSVTWRQALEKRRANPGFGEPYKVLDLNIIQDDLANAIVEIQWPGRLTYIDNLVFYKQGEDWKIVLKSFAAKDKVD